MLEMRNTCPRSTSTHNLIRNAPFLLYAAARCSGYCVREPTLDDNFLAFASTNITVLTASISANRARTYFYWYHNSENDWRNESLVNCSPGGASVCCVDARTWARSCTRPECGEPLELGHRRFYSPPPGLPPPRCLSWCLRSVSNV